MAYIYSNSLTQEEDFWRDVEEAPKKAMVKKSTSVFPFKVLNSNRMRKFDQFIQNQKQPLFNQSQEGISPKKLIEKIDRMILLGKRNDENRRRVYEQHIKEKESIEVSKCTFYPNMKHQPIQGQLKKSSALNKIQLLSNKMNNNSYYEKSQLWSRNLKGKKAKLKQQIQLEKKECSFTPHINQRSLDIVFNKVQSDFHLPQSVVFLRTQANNKKKRINSSQMTLTQSGEKKEKTTCTSRSMSFFCSIEVLKNELRNSAVNVKEDQD